MTRVFIAAAAPAGPGPAEWSSALALVAWDRAECLKSEAGSAVCAVRVLDREVVIKRLAFGSPWDRLKHALRASRGWRQWRGAAAAAAAGAPAAMPLAIGRDGAAELLVLERVPGEHALQHLADGLTIAQERALCDAVARCTAALIESGLMNGDHKPSNLMVTRLEPDPGALLAAATSPSPPTHAAHAAAVALVDTVDIRRVSPSGRQAALVRMLAALVIEPLGCGVPVRMALRRRGLRAVLRALWQSGGGDPASPGAVAADDAEYRAWESGSARTFWLKAGEIISAHKIGPPRVSPLRPR